FPPGRLRLRNEAVHLAAADVGYRARLPVRAAGVEVARVVVRPLTVSLDWIGDAGCELPARRAGEAVGARIGPEVRIEGAVLLHDHDHVLDLVDAGGRFRRLPLRAGGRRQR